MTRVLVVGLDGFDYQLASTWLADLPNLRELMERGAHGPLLSIVQPVTPPAWTSMVTGRNPGWFGFTDFTTRKPGSYAEQRLVHAGMVRADTVFDRADRAGLRTVALSVPVSYPPPRRQGGIVLSCIMAPSADRPVTHPPALKERWTSLLGQPLLFDAAITDSDVRGDRQALLHKLDALDRQRFDLARHLLAGGEWDLAFMVCTGTDRVAHYFLDDRHDPDAVHDHYVRCDQQLGGLLDDLPGDSAVLVASDHGVQRLDGTVNLNDWLARAGYLVLEEQVGTACRLVDAPVDWARTRAWASGFGGQIWLNRAGVLPLGWLDEEQADGVARELAAHLLELAGDDGQAPKVQVHSREELYSGPFAASCPDLCVQFDELRLLARNSVGHGQTISPPDGEDVASHAQHGFLALAGPGIGAVGTCHALSIYDIAPTILDLLRLDQGQLDGRSLLEDLREPYSVDDQAELASRLETLYLD